MENFEDQSPDVRAEALMREIAAEGGSDEGGETTEETSSAPAPDGKPAPTEEPAPAEPAPDAAAAERMARINAWREEQAAKAAERQRREHEQSLQQKVQELEAQLSKPQTQQVDLSTPEGFFEAAAKANIDPVQLAEYVSSELNNPSMVAQRAAQAAISPEVARLMEMVQAQNKELEQLKTSRQQELEQAQRQQIIHDFSGWVSQSHQGSLAHKVLAKKGLGAFTRAFDAARQRYGVPESAGPDAYFDAMEQMLHDELAEVRALIDDQPSTASRTTSGQAQAPGSMTLTNTVASERSAVIDDDDYADLPIHERMRRVAKMT